MNLVTLRFSQINFQVNNYVGDKMKYEVLLPWNEINSRLRNKSHTELLKIIADCYKLGDEVKYHLTLTVIDTNEELYKILQDLKKQMSLAFWVTKKSGEPLGPKLSDAKKVVTKVKKLTNNPEIILSFMLDYVENGIDFTCSYGDLWESYYTSIENMYHSAIKMILKNMDTIEIEKYLSRIDKMVAKTSGMGWGFYDTLTDYTDELMVGLDVQCKK